MPRPVEQMTLDPVELSKQAFQTAKTNGHFRHLEPGTLVAYADGKLFATAQTWEQLMDERHRQNLTGELFVEKL